MSRSAFGRAPPIVTPGASSRRSSSGTGSPSCKLRMSSWMRAASPSTGNGPNRRGRYSVADVETPSAPKRSSPAKYRYSSNESRGGLSRKRITRSPQRSGRASSTAPAAVSLSDGRNSSSISGRSSLSANPRSSHASAYRSETPRLARTRLSSPTSTGSVGHGEQPEVQLVGGAIIGRAHALSSGPRSCGRDAPRPNAASGSRAGAKPCGRRSRARRGLRSAPQARVARPPGR